MSDNETTAPLGMSAFFIRNKANEGRQLDLALPNGQASGHSLTVLSRHADKVAQALETLQRDRLKNAVKPLAERVSDKSLEMNVKISMVAGWTLPESFTEENVGTFLLNAPQIAEAIDQFSWNNSNFFGSV